MKLTPEEVFEKLQMNYDITHKEGKIQFNLGEVKIIVKQRDVIGNIMQEWLEAWLKKNRIEYMPNPNTQMPPDLFLDKDNLTHNLLEVKAFNYLASPAFDLADPVSFLAEIEKHPYMLHSKYIIFGYKMDEATGIVTVEDMWLKNIWELCAPTAMNYAMSVGGNAKKMRPTKWYKRSSKAKPIYKSLEHFLSAYIELLFVQHHNIAQDARDKIVKAYRKHYGITLDIPWWSAIKDEYIITRA